MLISLTQEIRPGISEADALEACMARIGAGEADALAELYSRTRVPVYSFALSILKNTADAEDVLHDCYLHVHAGAAAYRPQGKPLAWMLTITRNLCLKKLRERGRMADAPPEDWEQAWQARPEMTAEDRLLLAACMQRLSDQERQIVALHAVAGFKHREIAQMLDLGLSTVLSKYRRAIRKLGQQMSKEDAIDEA